MRPLPLMLAAAAGSIAAPAMAADLTVTLDVPTISTAAYHRPYVAVWIEQQDTAQTAVRTIALWYEAGATACGRFAARSLRVSLSHAELVIFDLRSHHRARSLQPTSAGEPDAAAREPDAATRERDAAAREHADRPAARHA